MAGTSGADNRLVSLPLSRIRVIMKSSPDVSNINQDALLLTAKATELFVQYLATYSYKHGTGKQKKELTYDDLSNTADESDVFQFLADILPKKISVTEYLKLLKEEEGVHPQEAVTEVEINVDEDNDDDEDEEEVDDGEGEEEDDEEEEDEDGEVNDDDDDDEDTD
ncbi:chromatin accessibility complex protein 1 [Ambystoma mexicanum]|uniref:chromatin accessibility complex protein 1 n=1 Tax=Ambystoma mexicanum TaxID=8296 RepID=UPI0037E88F2F